MIEEMNNRLTNMLPPFKAKFWGGKEDSDGFLSWNEPIIMFKDECKQSDDVDHICDEAVKIVVAPSRVPLEVGYTKPETTVKHLLAPGGPGLARWLNGAQDLLLMVDLELVKYKVVPEDTISHPPSEDMW